MKNVKVASVDAESIRFEDDTVLDSNHESDCCEHHYLSFSDLTLEDFEGLQFDLSNDKFFERVEGYGIALKPVNGHPVRVPGYGFNNGYYSSNLDLQLTKKGVVINRWDVSECQVIEG